MVCFSCLGFPNCFFSQKLACYHDKELKFESPPKEVQPLPQNILRVGRISWYWKGKEEEAGTGRREPQPPKVEKGRLSVHNHFNKLSTVASAVHLHGLEPSRNAWSGLQDFIWGLKWNPKQPPKSTELYNHVIFLTYSYTNTIHHPHSFPRHVVQSIRCHLTSENTIMEPLPPPPTTSIHPRSCCLSGN